MVRGTLLSAVMVLASLGFVSALHAEPPVYTLEAYDVLRAEVAAADTRLEILSEGSSAWTQAVRVAIDARTAARTYLEGWLRSRTMDDDMAGFALEAVLEFYAWTIEHQAALGNCGSAQQDNDGLHGFLVPGHRPHAEVRASADAHVERCLREERRGGIGESSRQGEEPSAHVGGTMSEPPHGEGTAGPSVTPDQAVSPVESPVAQRIWAVVGGQVALLPQAYGDRVDGGLTLGVQAGAEHSFLRRATLVHQATFLRNSGKGNDLRAVGRYVGLSSGLRVHSERARRDGLHVGTTVGLGGMFVREDRSTTWQRWGLAGEAHVGAHLEVVRLGLSIGALNLSNPVDSVVVAFSAGFRI